MKRTIKLILITLMTVVLTISMPLYSKALSLEELITNAESFENAGNSEGISTGISEDSLQPISNMVSNVLLTIAIGVTVISAAVMAINFTIQSVEDKAKVKESMVPWIIGIFISFGAYGIWQITMTIFYGMV